MANIETMKKSGILNEWKTNAGEVRYYVNLKKMLQYDYKAMKYDGFSGGQSSMINNSKLYYDKDGNAHFNKISTVDDERMNDIIARIENQYK